MKKQKRQKIKFLEDYHAVAEGVCGVKVRMGGQGCRGGERERGREAGTEGGRGVRGRVGGGGHFSGLSMLFEVWWEFEV